MLKLSIAPFALHHNHPAAFGRLCVETSETQNGQMFVGPAAFGRLCVETSETQNGQMFVGPAAFGRLCVETVYQLVFDSKVLPAAFGRLCVETNTETQKSYDFAQPPSGGCVLKLTDIDNPKQLFRPAAFGRLCVETCKCYCQHL